MSGDRGCRVQLVERPHVDHVGTPDRHLRRHGHRLGSPRGQVGRQAARVRREVSAPPAQRARRSRRSRAAPKRRGPALHQSAPQSALSPLRGRDGPARRRARARLRERERGRRPAPREAARGGWRPPHVHGRLDALAGRGPQGPPRPTRTSSTVCGDVREMGLPAASFDVVLVHWMLHDVPPWDRPSIVAELARLLCPGGRLFSREPTEPSTGCRRHRLARCSPPPASRRRSPTEGKAAVLGRYYRAVWIKPPA